MTKRADIGTKRLISLAPDRWAQWVTQCPDVTVHHLASSEFEWISRESDAALFAHHPDIGDFLILNEIQFSYKWHVPLRMNAYASLAAEKYHLPVFPVLVVMRPPGTGTGIPDRYEETTLGLYTRRDYQLIRLWEIDANIVLGQPLPTLLPFVPLLKGGEAEPAIRQALSKLRDDPELNEMETLLAFFASFVLESTLVQQIMRWDMTILRESPWYREILNEGIREGKAAGILEGKAEGILEGILEGKAAGKAEGIVEGQRRTLLRMLSIRFGTLPYPIERQLQHVEPEHLETLTDLALTAATLDEFAQALPPHIDL